MKKINKSQITNRWIMLIAYLLVGIFIGGTLGYTLTKDSSNEKLYKMCRSFNFMAYLNAENIRHYQNSTFEYSSLPNCEVYHGDYSTGKLTYEQFLTKNNLTHINWNDTKD